MNWKCEKILFVTHIHSFSNIKWNSQCGMAHHYTLLVCRKVIGVREMERIKTNQCSQRNPDTESRLSGTVSKIPTFRFGETSIALEDSIETLEFIESDANVQKRFTKCKHQSFNSEIRSCKHKISTFMCFKLSSLFCVLLLTQSVIAQY